ncbi:MAG: hypothetical protein PHI16_01260 [Methanocellales archaeon]|nr:hypothetical protein [Methanocellales archaeon]
MIYLIILLIAIWIGYTYAEKHEKFFASGLFYDGYGASPFVVFLGILLVTFIVIGGIIYFVSIGEVAEMEAFQETTLSVYEYTIDKSESITIDAVERAEKQFNEILDTGNLAYFELAKSVNNNIQELRESIKEYNTRLYSYRRYNDNWFTDSFLCDVPEYLKPIKMR